VLARYASLIVRSFAPRLVLVAVTLVVAEPIPARADVGATTIVVRALGPKPVRIRVAAGTVYPCDSLANERLYEGKPAVGTHVTINSAAECVCIDQTVEPFTDVGWTASRFQCRPRICTGHGKARRCRPDPDQTIRIDLRSAGSTG